MVTSEAIESHCNPQLTFERILSFATRFYRGLRPSRMTSGRRCSFVDIILQNPKETPHPFCLPHTPNLVFFARFCRRTSKRNALSFWSEVLASDRISLQPSTNFQKNLIFCYEILSGTPILESVRPLRNDKRRAVFRAFRMTALGLYTPHPSLRPILESVDTLPHTPRVFGFLCQRRGR